MKIISVCFRDVKLNAFRLWLHTTYTNLEKYTVDMVQFYSKTTAQIEILDNKILEIYTQKLTISWIQEGICNLIYFMGNIHQNKMLLATIRSSDDKKKKKKKKIANL